MDWSYHSFECGYDFLGGFQYLDHCGMLMSWAESELSYFVNSIDGQKAQAVKEQHGLNATVSANKFIITQNDPTDKGNIVLGEFNLWQENFITQIVPRSLEKAYVKVNSVHFVNSEDDVFEITRKIHNPVFDKLSEKFAMPKLMQDVILRFKSGTSGLNCCVHGISFQAKTVDNSFAFFATKRQNDMIKALNKYQERISRKKYNFGVILTVEAFETEPIFPRIENNWNKEYFAGLFNKALKSTDTIKAELKI